MNIRCVVSNLISETVKDLAKALGLLCVVTNCGEGMDFKVSSSLPSPHAQFLSVLGPRFVVLVSAS